MNRAVTLASLSCIAGVLLAVAGSPLRAQAPSPQPSDPNANAPQSGDRKPSPEGRRKWREDLQRRLDARRQELTRFEAALKALDEGKTVEEVRQMYPDLPRFGMRGEGHDQDRGGDGGHRPDGADIDHLGPQMIGGRGGGGQPGAGGSPGGGQDQPHPLTAEERQGVHDVLEATSPQLFKHLQELENSSPAEAERKISESLPRMRFLLELRKRDAKLYDYKLKDIQHGREAFDSARAIATMDAKPDSGSTADRAKLEGSLRAALTAQYKVRTLAIQREAEGLKERGASLLADAEKRDAQAGAVVEKNMKSMIDREKKRLEKHADKDRRGSNDHKAGPDDKPAQPPS